MRLKAFVKKALRKINHKLLLIPGLHQKLIACFRILGLDASLKWLHAKAYGSYKYSNGFQSAQSSLTRQLKNLPPSAQQIYADLKYAIEQQKHGRK